MRPDGICKRKIAYIFRHLRAKKITSLIKYNNTTDIGAGDDLLKRYMPNKNYEWYDINSTHHYINVEALPFKNNSKEVVLCCEVLEHTYNPVKAIKELKRVYSKQLIITIPNEPIFSITRGGWYPEHLWALTPKLLRYYLGKPKFENKMIFNRYYVGVWEK